MSDNTTNYDDVTPLRRLGADDPDGYTDEDISSKDFVLDVVMSGYVGFKDELEGSISMTIQCGGNIVSGMVISETAWTSLMCEQLREGGSPALADAAEEALLRRLADAGEEHDRRDAADLNGRARRFIHMQDAKIFDGERDVNVPLWRGAMKDISGWSLGAWNQPGV